MTGPRSHSDEDSESLHTPHTIDACDTTAHNRNTESGSGFVGNKSMGNLTIRKRNKQTDYHFQALNLTIPKHVGGFGPKAQYNNTAWDKEHKDGQTSVNEGPNEKKRVPIYSRPVEAPLAMEKPARESEILVLVADPGPFLKWWTISAEHGKWGCKTGLCTLTYRCPREPFRTNIAPSPKQKGVHQAPPVHYGR